MLTSTLSQRQFPHGLCSTTSHRTLRARHDTQARAARRLVFFALLLLSGLVVVESDLFLVVGGVCLPLPLSPVGFFELSVALSAWDWGGGEPAADVSEASEFILAASCLFFFFLCRVRPGGVQRD